MTILEQIFTWTLRASWHASILVVVVLLIQQLFRKQLTATWRYTLWFAVLIRLAVPFMPSSPISPLNIPPRIQSETVPHVLSKGVSLPLKMDRFISIPVNHTAPLSPVSSTTIVPTMGKKSNEATFPKIEWYRIAAALWALGTLFFLLRLIAQNLRFRQRLASLPVATGDVYYRPLRRAAASLNMPHQTLPLLEGPEIKSPCIYGLFRPSLLLPSDLHHRLKEEELECVFLHELAHIKRRDPIINGIINLLLCVHWFNPVVWVAIRQIQADRELATDARVLQTVDRDGRKVYGETIVRLLETLNHHSHSLPGTVGIVEGKRNIRDRITRIAAYSRASKTPKLVLAFAIGLIAVFMLDAQNHEQRPSTGRSEKGVSGKSNLPPTTIVGVDSDSKTALSGTEVTIDSLKKIADTGTRLQGRVLDQNGDPLNGARLRPITGKRNTATTDSGGQFRFDTTFTGPVNLVVIAAGHAPRLLSLDDSEILERQEIRLEAGNKLHLRFIDSTGSPMPNVRITPDNWAGHRHALFSNKFSSDENGAFSWTDAPADAVEFSFLKPGYRFIRNYPLTARRTPYTITIEPELKVTFEVTDETGRPVPEFLVDHGQPQETVQGNRSIYWSISGGGKGWNGSLEIAESFPVVSGTPFDRSYVYRIEAGGYRSVITREVTVDEGQVTLAVSLQKVENSILTLQLPSGAPIPNRHLWLIGPNDSIRMTEDFDVYPSNSRLIETDSEGHFTVPIRNDDDFLFTSLPEGFLLVRRSQASSYIVQPWGSIKGTWKENGIPTSNILCRVKFSE
jgi:beta-lactamase regulating signal transducer with metallopeptidase domain